MLRSATGRGSLSVAEYSNQLGGQVRMSRGPESGVSAPPRGDHSLESFHRLFPVLFVPVSRLSFSPLIPSLPFLLEPSRAAFLFIPLFTKAESATSMAEPTPSPRPEPNGAVKQSVHRTPMKRLAPVPSRHFLDWLLKYQIRGSPLPIDCPKLQLTCGNLKSSHRR
jgi:hypothetical protein